MSETSYKFNNNILEYSLVIQSSKYSYYGDDGKKVDGCPPIVSGKRMRIAHKSVDKDLYMTLYGVKFRRRIYETGLIQAELMIQTEAAIDIKTLRGLFMFCPASLAVQGKDIATNYFVNNVSPQYEFGNDNKYSYIYVKLDIVSNDTAFKFSRFSKVHLGEKFIGTTVAKMAQKLGVAMRELDKSELQNLAYTDSNKSVEYIQPYVVQYNECFYDFMKRIANRCGEAFYFEDGKLCFGLPKNGSTTNVAGAKRIIFKHVAHGPNSYDSLPVSTYARDSLKEYRSYTKDSKEYWTYEPKDGDIMTDAIEKSDGFPKEAFPSSKYVYKSEIASEDHYMLLFKDKFARDGSTDLWVGDPDARAMGWISQFLNSTSLLEFVSKFAVTEVDNALKLFNKYHKTTDAGNSALKEAALDEDNDYAVLFSKVDDNKEDHWITLKYYQDIQSDEELASRRMIYVDMGERYCDIKLGDKITIPNNDGVTYIVVDIEMSSGVPWQRSYDDLSDTPAPSGGAQSQRFYAIPLAADGKFYPPVIMDKPFRTSGPQPAFIVDAGDFAGQGRVRIRYPWQSSADEEKTAVNDAETAMNTAKTELENYAKVEIKDDGTVNIEMFEDADETKFNNAKSDYTTKRSKWIDAKFDLVIAEAASPWIRMAVPMATDGGGMYFQPAKGDEVMVDYENGNIDRPFVIGTLFSKNTPAPTLRGKRVIVSPNGHTIKMDDPTDANLILQGLFPAMKFLGNFGVKIKGLDGKAQAYLGGIEITDKPGLYSIKMSSHDRQIKISSPLGNVKVDALTGISIDAPNGDISITGKNINISAYNNLNITSGKNIKQGRGAWLFSLFDGKAWGEATAKVGMGIALKFFDMSLIRTFIEIFIRPIDGTLKIKSNRYLQVEAGKGSSADEATEYASRPMDKRSKSKAEHAAIITQLIPDINAAIDAFVPQYIKAFNDVKASCDKFPLAAFGNNKSVQTPDTKEKFIKYFFENTPKTEREVVGFVNGLFADQNKFKLKDSYGSNDPNRRWRLRRAMELMTKEIIILKKQSSDYEHLMDGLGGHKYDAWRLHTVCPPLLKSEPAIIAGAGGGGATHELYADSIKKICDFANNPDLSVFDNLLNEADFAEWKKFVKRRIAHAIIERCRAQDNPVEGCTFPAAEYGVVRTVDATGAITSNDTTPGDSANPFTDADWPKYVGAVRVHEKESSAFVKGLVDTGGNMIMNKIMPYEWWIWKPSSQGKILFSDQPGKTVRFRNGETESYENPDRLFGDMERTIQTALNI